MSSEKRKRVKKSQQKKKRRTQQLFGWRTWIAKLENANHTANENGDEKPQRQQQQSHAGDNEEQWRIASFRHGQKARRNFLQ
jgi:hypothetical protein